MKKHLYQSNLNEIIQFDTEPYRPLNLKFRFNFVLFDKKKSHLNPTEPKKETT